MGNSAPHHRQDPDDRMFRDWYGTSPTLLKLVAKSDIVGLRRYVRRLTISCLRQRDNQGETVLHVAAQLGNVEALRLLLETLSKRVKKRGSKGCLKQELNRKSFAGHTPLHTAMANAEYAAAAVLLDFGAQPGLCTDVAQEDELSLLFTNYVSQIQVGHPPSQAAVRILDRLHEAKARPDKTVRPRVTSLVVLLMEACQRHVVDTQAFDELLERVLRVWPDIQLRNDTILLQVAMRNTRLFRRIWRYFQERQHQLSPENLNVQIDNGNTLLMQSVLEGDEATTLLILEADVDALKWHNIPLREVTCPATMEEAVECSCPDDEDVEEMEDDEEEEEADALDCVTPTADMMCPLAVAMRRQQTEVVWRILEANPQLWRAKWSLLVECCRRSCSVAWLSRVVCRQARSGRRVRMRPLLTAELFPGGFAPYTAMDIAMKMMVTLRGRHVDTGLPMSPAFMRRHAKILFSSAGCKETRPSWALIDVLERCPAAESQALAPLLDIVRHRPSREAELTLFRSCLHSRALLLAAVGRGLRPDVDWNEVGTGSPICLELKAAIEDSDCPRFAWAVVVVLLRCHKRLSTICPDYCRIQQRPFPLMWQALGAVRTNLESNGYRTEEEMEQQLEQIGVAPVTTDLILMRDVSESLLNHGDA